MFRWLNTHLWKLTMWQVIIIHIKVVPFKHLFCMTGPCCSIKQVGGIMHTRHVHDMGHTIQVCPWLRIHIVLT